MKTKHFKPTEWACRCGCGYDDLDSELVAVLELVRNVFKKPVRITSGLRCESHNANVGGAKKSKHVQGLAADIVVDGIEPSVVYEFLNDVFPSSYGLGNAETFTHIDVRSCPARWTY